MADESSSWLIQRSRECLSVGDNDGADAWIFTATSLYPHSFPVQHEVLHTQMKAGQIAQAALQLANMLQRFNNKKELWQDVHSMLTAVSSEANDATSERWRYLFGALDSDVQQEMLRSCAEQCEDDVLSQCQLFIQLMKLFPGTVLEFGLETVKLLSRCSSHRLLCQKMLVNEALPLLLSSCHCQALLSRVPVDEIVFWLYKALFYCSQNCSECLISTAASDFMKTDLMSPTLTSPSTPRRSSIANRVKPENVLRDSWLMLLRLVQSIGLFLRWNIPSELCNSALLLSERVAVLKSLPKSHPAYFHVSFVLLLESLAKYRAALHMNSANESPLVMVSSIAESESQHGSEVQTLAVLGGTEGGKKVISDLFRCAVLCWDAVHSDKTLKTDFVNLRKKWSSADWEMIDSFEVDCWLYKRNFSQVVAYLQSLGEGDSLAATMARLKQASCLAKMGNLAKSCELAMSVLLSVLDEMHISVGDELPDSELADFTNSADVLLLPFDAVYVVPYCVAIAAEHYKSIAFEVERNDIALSHLMVLCQYDWPNMHQLFLQVMKRVKDNRGLIFESFFKYIRDIDMLEEMMWLSNTDTCQLCLLPSSSQRQRTVTRGVDKESKEELRDAFENQAKYAEDKFISTLYLFVQDTVRKP
ncbi:integrator complex subunit 10-like [Corticium candelabrum]|uniref:integrator complex subunit 10-like n=1 Tax=Corticium candelabrum TaxID=121492 RepID=UPI002E26E3F7|nr:integrator complex subunit 10-like [Corticium candelabrum]